MPRANRLRVVRPAAKPKDQAPSSKEVDAWLGSLPDKFIACRVRHAEFKLKDMWPEGKGFGKLYRCPRCRLEIEVHENAAGFIVDQKPNYPQGYLAPKGYGRNTRERNAAVRRRRSLNEWRQLKGED